MLEGGGVVVQNVRETQPASRIVPLARDSCKSSNQTVPEGKLYDPNKRMQ